MNQGTSHSREQDLRLAINEVIGNLNLGQREIADRCREAGYAVSQSTISKLLTGKQRLTIEHVEMFADVTGCSFEVLVENSRRKMRQGRLLLNTALPTQYLVMNPYDDPEAFRGYLGEYWTYYLSTSTTEQGKVVKAYLKIEERKGYCYVSLTIPTGADKVKKYEGQMLVSKEMKTGYIFLLNAKTGEITSVYMRYRSMRVEDLLSRVGLMMTISSGDSALPTVSYLLISRRELNEEYVPDLLRMSGEYYLMLDIDEELHRYIDFLGFSPVADKPVAIDRIILRRKLLNAGKEQDYLRAVSLLHKTAINTIERIQIDEEIDLEFFEVSKRIKEGQDQSERPDIKDAGKEKNSFHDTG